MRSKNTRPELALGKALLERGIEFDTHVAGLPGTPDIVFRASRLAVFVHGCYWHRHLGCDRARTPQTNTFAWLRRFASNVQRDQSVMRQLLLDGWWTFVAWECEVLGNAASVTDALLAELDRRDELLASTQLTHTHLGPGA